MRKKTGKRSLAGTAGKKINIPIIRPLFDYHEKEALARVIDSGWVTQGPKVAEFEEMVAKYTGSKYAVATTSATTSLFLSLYMLGVGKGDEVIVPSFSFIATANVVVHVGAKPVFVDIDPATYNIDSKLIERTISKRTKVILPVDQVGLPADLEEIKKIARKYKLHVVEDAACAFGSVYKGKKVGSISEITCLSFHPRKLVTTGEGGMILTNNEKFAQRAMRLRHHGMGMTDLARHSSKKIVHEKYSEIGYNLRMSDLEATVGIEQLKKFPNNLAKRRNLARKYDIAFAKNDLIEPPFVPKDRIHNYQTYIVRLKKNNKISRDGLMQKLLDVGISTRRGVMAAHEETPYKKMYPNLVLPETESAVRETIAIPLFAQMTTAEQKYVINKINEFTK